MCCRISFSYLRIKGKTINTLFFVRHGQASFGEDDYDNLSDLGLKQSIELGKALAKQKLNFDKAIVGPLKRHIQTFDGIIEGYNANEKIPFSIENGFAENHLMEVTQYFAPKLLQSDSKLIDLYKNYENDNQEKKFFKMFQYIALKWANSELDLTNTDLESYTNFRSRVKKSLNTIQNSLPESSNILVVTSGGVISALYGEATQCSPQDIQKQNFAIKNASISEFSCTTERFTLKTFNVSFLSKELETYI